MFQNRLFIGGSVKIRLQENVAVPNRYQHPLQALFESVWQTTRSLHPEELPKLYLLHAASNGPEVACQAI